jgi:glycosyltransferase involved in cell wall biosynthesis
LRIAIWQDPPPGGALRSLVQLITRLAAEHDVELFAVEGSPQADAASSLPGSVRVNCLPFRARPHVRRALYWNDWLSYRDAQDFQTLEREVARRFDAGNFDVGLVSMLRNGQAPAVLRFAHLPTAYFCQEPPRRFHERWARPGAAPLSLYERARRVWRWPTYALLDASVRRRDLEHVGHASAVFANSAYTRSRIKAVYGRDAEVCRLGVDAEWFRPADDPAGATAVLSVGALEAHKGFDFVIRALGRIPENRRPALTIAGVAGHPRMERQLLELASGLSVRATIETAVSDDRLRALYQTHGVFAFGAHQEPFGLVVLEAMAAGLPVVAVREGGVPEIVVDGVTGLLAPREEGAFAEALDSLLVDPKRRLAMGSAGRAEVLLTWTWEASARELASRLGSLRAAVSQAAG